MGIVKKMIFWIARRDKATNLQSMTTNSNNRFQVTPYQVQRLLEMEIPENMTAKEWLKKCEDKDIQDLMFFQDVSKDQRMRSLHIAETFWMDDYQILVMLDGHGRMLYQILRDLEQHQVDIDAITVYIVELDPITHLWHEIFFPKNVISMNGNILELLNLHIKNDPMNTACVLPYLNFCGLHNQQRRVWNLLECWRGKGDFFLSFSLMGQAGKNGGSKWNFRHCYKNVDKVMGLVGQLYSLEKSEYACVISQRGWGVNSKVPFFITYQIF